MKLKYEFPQFALSIQEMKRFVDLYDTHGYYLKGIPCVFGYFTGNPRKRWVYKGLTVFENSIWSVQGRHKHGKWKLRAIEHFGEWLHDKERNVKAKQKILTNYHKAIIHVKNRKTGEIISTKKS